MDVSNHRAALQLQLRQVMWLRSSAVGWRRYPRMDPTLDPNAPVRVETRRDEISSLRAASRYGIKRFRMGRGLAPDMEEFRDLRGLVGTAQIC
jgi:hypothetical protein